MTRIELGIRETRPLCLKVVPKTTDKAAHLAQVMPMATSAIPPLPAARAAAYRVSWSSAYDPERPLGICAILHQLCHLAHE